MKKISIKNMLSVAVPLVIVACILLLFISVNGSEIGSLTTEVKTPIQITIDNTHSDTWQKAAENDGYVLYANLKKAIIKLENKTDGSIWTSSPEGYESNAEIKGAAKVVLGSLLNFSYADRDSNSTIQNSVAGCVNDDTLNAKFIQNGVRFDFYFEKEGFLIPLELTLTENGLRASVPLTDIQEESSSMKLTSITPLPNFGAGNFNEDGYVFVPDESGTRIPFIKGDAGYSGRVYGGDLAIVSKTSSTLSGDALLPVFGVKKQQQAMLAIITEGDARAKINANPASAKSPYCTVSAEFIYRESTLVDVSQKTFEFTQVNMFEPDSCQINAFTVEYRPVKQPDYVGMANAYRSYLIDSCGLSAMTTPTSSLYVQLVGGVMRQESLLGIPVNRVTPVTTYEDAVMLADSLRDAGVDALTMNYIDWAKSGSYSRLTVDLAAESRLGGSGALQKMLTSLKQSGVKMYLDLNLTDMMQSQWGYSTKYSSTQSVQREPAIQYSYKMSTFHIDSTADLLFLLSPNHLLNATKQVTAKADSLTPAGYSLNSLGQKLYSDLGDNHVDRGSALTVWQQTLQTLSESGARVFTHANAYVFPYATDLQDVPLYTSDYNIQGEPVPFYTIALHGLVSMSTPSINGQEDSRETFLKALETGVNLKYTFGARNTDKLGETGSDLYYIDYSNWLDEAVNNYTQVSGYLSKVSNQAVVSHEKLQSGVYRTVFANGIGVIVNYTDEAVTVDGRTVDAENYAGIGW